MNSFTCTVYVPINRIACWTTATTSPTPPPRAPLPTRSKFVANYSTASLQWIANELQDMPWASLDVARTCSGITLDSWRKACPSTDKGFRWGQTSTCSPRRKSDSLRNQIFWKQQQLYLRKFCTKWPIACSRWPIVQRSVISNLEVSTAKLSTHGGVAAWESMCTYPWTLVWTPQKVLVCVFPWKPHERNCLGYSLSRTPATPKFQKYPECFVQNWKCLHKWSIFQNPGDLLYIWSSNTCR